MNLLPSKTVATDTLMSMAESSKPSRRNTRPNFAKHTQSWDPADTAKSADSPMGPMNLFC